MTLPRLSAALLPRIDCRRPLRDVIASAMAHSDASEEAVWVDWDELSRQLVGVGFLTMVDVWAQEETLHS
eukprot:533380-Prymnesium_polylepis.1